MKTFVIVTSLVFAFDLFGKLVMLGSNVIPQRTRGMLALDTLIGVAMILLAALAWGGIVP